MPACALSQPPRCPVTQPARRRPADGSQPNGPSPARPLSEHTFQGPRDLESASYREFLVSRHGLERNEIVGKYIFERRTFDSFEQVLAAAHAHELAICAQALPRSDGHRGTGPAGA